MFGVCVATLVCGLVRRVRPWGWLGFLFRRGKCYAWLYLFFYLWDASGTYVALLLVLSSILRSVLLSSVCLHCPVGVELIELFSVRVGAYSFVCFQGRVSLPIFCTAVCGLPYSLLLS